MTDAYESITESEFEKRLIIELDITTGEELLTIEGVRELVTEHFRDKIEWEYADENAHYMEESDVLAMFLDGQTINEIRRKYDYDDTALREDYNNYTDCLCKDGTITQYLYENMENPF